MKFPGDFLLTEGTQANTMIVTWKINILIYLNKQRKGICRSIIREIHIIMYKVIFGTIFNNLQINICTNVIPVNYMKCEFNSFLCIKFHINAIFIFFVGLNRPAHINLSDSVLLCRFRIQKSYCFYSRMFQQWLWCKTTDFRLPTFWHLQKRQRPIWWRMSKEFEPSKYHRLSEWNPVGPDTILT